jgi:hypothetical protein
VSVRRRRRPRWVGAGAVAGAHPLRFLEPQPQDTSIQAWPMPISGSVPINMWAFES